MTAEKESAQLCYDGDCPVCSLYSRKARLADGELLRVNAREQCELIDEISAAGYDLDEGMILKLGDKLYFGSDALHELAVRSSGKGIFNRTMSSIFRNPKIARAVYPVLTACRKLLLKLLGRSKINSGRRSRR